MRDNKASCALQCLASDSHFLSLLAAQLLLLMIPHRMPVTLKLMGGLQSRLQQRLQLLTGPRQCRHLLTQKHHQQKGIMHKDILMLMASWMRERCALTDHAYMHDSDIHVCVLTLSVWTMSSRRSLWMTGPSARARGQRICRPTLQMRCLTVTIFISALRPACFALYVQKA